MYPYEQETTIGGKYPVRHDQTLFILTPMLHRDPKVWGADAEAFNLDHFAFENAEKLPPNAWKPFGNGQRSCIGRPFALQEATLLLAMMLQRFDLSPADPGYKLEIKETLTLKPHGLYIHAKRRDNVIVKAAQPPGAGTLPSAEPSTPNGPQTSNGIPIRVLFGSNAGSSEAFAQRIATDARAQSYAPSVGSLDSAAGHLPKEGAVIIVTASYEGQPPDNARQFVSWMDGLPADALKGVKYAVFGCGNKDWACTCQAIPKKIDQKLAEAGAERLVERGEANARGDFGDFDRWYADF